MIWALVLAVAGATCPSSSTFQALSRALVQGEQAIRESDREALDAAERDAEELVRCMRSPLSPTDVASYMRLRGIAHFVRKERDDAVLWLEGARSVEPSYSLPVSLIPTQHPLRTLFESIEVPDEHLVRLPLPEEGLVEIDGRPSSQLPERLPWVLQWRDGTGAIVVTEIGVGVPDELPYPARHRWGRWQVVVSVSSQVAVTTDPGPVRFGGVGRGLVELGGPVSLDAGLRAHFTRVPEPGKVGIRQIPGVHLGLRGWLPTRAVRPFVGALFVATSHQDRAVQPGGAATFGLRLGQQRRFVDLGVEAGYSRDPYVQLDVGVGLGR